MARTSKKAGRIKSLEQTVEEAEPVWKAGIYTRLSVDSNDRKNESIDTQIEIAKEYINQADDIELMECYSDLGKTGTDFRRDGFESMMKDIREKKINCVVVKDFSRFGRNYIETGNYIEKIFPFMKVRFVAVTDGYDSEHLTGDHDQLSMNLKNIVNELYARDIAQRVKTAKKLKQEMGSYTGGAPPYGYCVKEIGGKKVLFPDSNTKDIVIGIFERYAEGNSREEIVRELYQKRIYRPLIYRKTKEVYCPKGESLEQWSSSTIKWILTNPVYIGTLFQARICGKEYQGHKRHELKDEDLTVVEHAHEPLVSEDLFFKAAQRLERQVKYTNKDVSFKNIPQGEDMWKGKVYCGECGHNLIRKTQVKTLAKGNKVRRYYYVCPNRYRIDGRACQCQRIMLGALETILKEILEKEFCLLKSRSKDYCKENMQEAKKKKNMIRKKKDESVRRQEEFVLAGSKRYLRYREGRISRETFLEEKKKAEEELESLKKQEKNWEKQEMRIDKNANKTNRFIQGLMRCKGDYQFDRELAEYMIKRISVYDERRVEVIWNYSENDLLYGREIDEQTVQDCGLSASVQRR